MKLALYQTSGKNYLALASGSDHLIQEAMEICDPTQVRTDIAAYLFQEGLPTIQCQAPAKVTPLPAESEYYLKYCEGLAKEARALALAETTQLTFKHFRTLLGKP